MAIQVISSPSKDKKFSSALLISKEREEEIDDILDNAIENTNDYSEILAITAKGLNSPNELAYASFLLGVFAENKRLKQKLVEKVLS